MDMITNLWNNIVTQFQLYAPSILMALVLVVVAWVVATILRAIVVRVLQAFKFDERFGRDVGNPNTTTPLSRVIGTAVFWLTILFFLPAIVGALNIPGIFLPIQNMLTTALNFLPNILAAVVIFAVGWLVASVVKRVLVALFDAIGVDRLAQRVGVDRALGTQRLSNILATIVYFLILIPVFIAALNALQIDAITEPASAMLNNILLAIPNIFAAFLLLGIAYVVGQVVSGLISNLLALVGFNRLAGALGLGRAQAAVDRAAAQMESGARTVTSTTRPAASSPDISTGAFDEPKISLPTKRQPSDIAGYLVLVAIMLFAAVEALRLVGFAELAAIALQFLALFGQVLLGLIIFGVGLWLANLVANVIQETGSGWANILAPAARIAILILAGAMALSQMGLAPEIVTLAFGLSLGAVAVAAALAFGLGGREQAAQLIREWRGKVEERAQPRQLTGAGSPQSYRPSASNPAE